MFHFFVEFCTTISRNIDDRISSDDSPSGFIPLDNNDAVEPFVNHPFRMKDTNAAIKMNIRVSKLQ